MSATSPEYFQPHHPIHGVTFYMTWVYFAAVVPPEGLVAADLIARKIRK
jgi:hypothetical protein